MRDPSQRYEFPVSIGLLVIRVSRTVTARKEIENERNTHTESLSDITENIKKTTRADFLGCYKNPPEMQVSHGWGENEDQYRIFPGVIFAAVVHGNTA